MPKHAKSQISLELTVSIFLALLLLVAMARVFVWLNTLVVLRQVDYEQQREDAGGADIPECEGCYNITQWEERPLERCYQAHFPYFCNNPAPDGKRCLFGCYMAKKYARINDSFCLGREVIPPETPFLCCLHRRRIQPLQVDEGDYPRLEIFRNWPRAN